MNDDRDDLDPRLLSGAHALDAVDDTERADFDAAAAASPTLRAEARQLGETAALLGLASTPVEPPAGMKAALMAKLLDTPQLAPLPVTVPVPASAPDAPTPAASVPDAPTPVGGPVEQAARRRWYAGPIGILTAVAAAAALFVGGGVIGGALTAQPTAPVIDASGSALAELTAAPDVQRTSVELDGGGTATLVWSAALERSAVLTDGLTALPDDQVYEAWYIDADGAAPAGTFTAAADGTTWHVLDGAMAAGDTIGVTVEPAGGSPAPTTDPVIVLASA